MAPVLSLRHSNEMGEHKLNKTEKFIAGILEARAVIGNVRDRIQSGVSNVKKDSAEVLHIDLVLGDAFRSTFLKTQTESEIKTVARTTLSTFFERIGVTFHRDESSKFENPFSQAQRP